MGKKPSELSSVRYTSAMPARGRPSPPAKMRSSVFLARKAEKTCSPNTQRKPSATFDLPDPFGPTMAVTPVGKTNSVLVAKVLNPCISRCFSRIAAALYLVLGQEATLKTLDSTQVLD